MSIADRPQIYRDNLLQLAACTWLYHKFSQELQSLALLAGIEAKYLVYS